MGLLAGYWSWLRARWPLFWGGALLGGLLTLAGPLNPLFLWLGLPGFLFGAGFASVFGGDLAFLVLWANALVYGHLVAALLSKE